MGEILPAKIRGTAASVATGFNWSCTFIVTKTFADLIGRFCKGVFFSFNQSSEINFIYLLPQMHSVYMESFGYLQAFV